MAAGSAYWIDQRGQFLTHGLIGGLGGEERGRIGRRTRRGRFSGAGAAPGSAGAASRGALRDELAAISGAALALPLWSRAMTSTFWILAGSCRGLNDEVAARVAQQGGQTSRAGPGPEVTDAIFRPPTPSGTSIFTPVSAATSERISRASH